MKRFGQNAAQGSPLVGQYNGRVLRMNSLQRQSRSNSRI